MKNQLQTQKLEFFDKTYQEELKQEKLFRKEQNIQFALTNLKSSLEACGKWAKHEIYCRSCENEHKEESLLAVTKQIHICEVRLCNKPLCVSQRYSKVMGSFEKVRRLKDLLKLRHFSIGFEKISKEEFENSFDYHKKKFERVLNNYFKRLKTGNFLPYEFRNKKNLIKAHSQDVRNQTYIKKHPDDVFFKPIKIQGFKVLDISKGKKISSNWDEQYYIHFHFAIIPFKRGGHEVATMKAVEQMIKKKQRKKIPFFYKDYGNKNKKSILSYLAIRLIGLYKKYETKKDELQDSKHFYNAKSIRKSLVAGKWMTLNQLVTPEQYLKHFYKKRNLSTIGNSYFCYNCKKSIPLRTDGNPTYAKGEEKICPYCNSNDVKLAMPKSLQGSISADIVVLISCKYHGKFNINDFFHLRHVFTILEDPPPPDIQLGKRRKSQITLINSPRMDVVDEDGNTLNFKLNSKIRFYEQLHRKSNIFRKLIHKKPEKRLMDDIPMVIIGNDIRKFGIDPIIKTRDKELPPLEKLDVSKESTFRNTHETTFENTQKRVNRLIDLKNGKKITFSLRDYIDLGILGKC